MLSLSQRKRLLALLRRKERAKRGRFIAEGTRVVEDLLDAGTRVTECIHSEEALANPTVGAIVSRIRDAGAPCHSIPARELAAYSDTITPQGLIVIAEIPRSGWDDLASFPLLVVDGVQDPGNLGTLIRTAEALGAGGMIVLPGTTDPWSPKSVRAAAGASFRLPILELGHEETVTGLRARQVPLWVSDASGEPIRREDQPPSRVAIAVGNEGAGVSDALRQAAERTVAIEQSDQTESLNVAVAAALLLDRIRGR